MIEALEATIVFEKNWDAIHELAYNEDGSPVIDFETGQHTHKYKYIINEGSSRSSKTYSLIDCIDLYARESDAKRLTVWRDTKTDCKKTVLSDTLKHLKRTGRYKVEQDFNKTESIFTYDTGTTFEIHGTDDEETVHGLTQDAAWLNEPYKISRDTFDQIDQRTSDFIFIDWNPKKAHWIDDLKKDPRSIVIHSTFKDNPFCPPEQRRKILSYQPISMCRLVESGQLNESEAREYSVIENPNGYPVKDINELQRCKDNEAKNSASAFKWSVYGLGKKAEKPNRIFKWNRCTIDDYNAIDATEIVGVDWGKVDPFGILKAKYYDGCLYLRQLNYASENSIKERLTSTERAQIEAIPEGIVQWLFLRLGIDYNTVIVCDSNRRLKILALRQIGYDYAIEAVKGPGSVIDGIDLLDKLTIYYTEDSKDLEYEQENYSYKVDKYGVVEEEPEDVDNHLIDPTRYIAEFLRSEGIIKIV